MERFIILGSIAIFAATLVSWSCAAAEKGAPEVRQVVQKLETRTTLSFVAVGDTQISMDGDGSGCKVSGGWGANQTSLLVGAINELPGDNPAKWPSILVGEGPLPFDEAGNDFSFPTHGLLMAGDITESANDPWKNELPGGGPECLEWEAFNAAFPVAGSGGSGNGELDTPTFEGYGNHDFRFQDTLEDAESQSNRGWIVDKIEERSAPSDPAWSTSRGADQVATFAQDDGRGSYDWSWDADDNIHFFNLNVKPSGTLGSTGLAQYRCDATTLKKYGYFDPCDGKSYPDSCFVPTAEWEPDQNHEPSIYEMITVAGGHEVKIESGAWRVSVDSAKRCRQYIDKTAEANKGWRVVDPHDSLAYLDERLETIGSNKQLVVMTHYGPRSQKVLTQNELDNFCGILTKHRARVIAWVVGHTHSSDYYEWECHDYRVPVFNVGSSFDLVHKNALQTHFTYFRISNEWLEAVDVGRGVVGSGEGRTGGAYQIPGGQYGKTRGCSNQVTAAKADAIYDAFVEASPDPTDDRCNPDGLWGGWAVRVPICKPDENPYLEIPLERTTLVVPNSSCLWQR